MYSSFKGSSKGSVKSCFEGLFLRVPCCSKGFRKGFLKGPATGFRSRFLQKLFSKHAPKGPSTLTVGFQGPKAIRSVDFGA